MAVRGCVSLTAFFCFVLSVFFLEFRWVCLAVLVGGVARLRGCLCVRSASAGSVLVVVVSVVVVL